MRTIVMKLWPLACIFFIWVLFCSPYFFRGQVPFPSQYQHNFFDPWSAYNTAHGPYKNGAMPDLISQLYPWKKLTIDTLKQGHIPFWNPYSFSGTPHLANYQSAVFTPFNILFFFLSFVDAWSWLVLLQPLLAGCFMYIFVRSLRVSHTGSLISSISFMFCGFMTVWMAYGTLGYAILFLPLALFSIEKYVQTRSWRYLLLLIVTIPLSFFSGHFQTSIYFFLAVISYAIWHMCSVYISKTQTAAQKRIILLSLSFAIVSGLLITMVQIIPSMEFYTQSLRSGLFAKGEVIPWGYVPTLLAPDVFGNPVTRNDWFGHYAEWNGYIGLIPLLLGVYSLLRIRTKQVLFFSIAGLLCLLLAFPTPLLDVIIFLHIPVLSTSAASRIIVLFSFFFTVLAGLGFDMYIQDIKNRSWKSIWIIFIGTSIVFCLLWIIIVSKMFIPLDKLGIAHQNMILPSMLFSGFIFISAAGYIFHKYQLRYQRLFAVIIVIIVAVDMLRFAVKWMPFDPKDLVFSSTPINTFYSKILPTERVFGNFGAEDTVYYHIAGIEGYDALYNKQYGDFMKYIDGGMYGHSEKSLVVLPKNGNYTKDALDLLAVQYVVHKTSDGHATWTLPFWSYQDHEYTKVFDDGVFDIFRNQQALPMAWFSSDYLVISDEHKQLQHLFSDNTLRTRIIVGKYPGFPAQKTKTSTVTISHYSANKVAITVHALSDGLVFLADSYYPGWSVSIDGKSTAIMRADDIFRAVRVTKGDHEIVFSYLPQSFLIGLSLSIIGFAGALSIVLISSKAFSKKRVH